jgi:GNAT superfamily N-acetyltransferase
MSEVDRLQAYLRASAENSYAAVPVPPFTLFFHPTDALTFFNYAIPDRPVGGDLDAPLERLRQEFLTRNRVPRFEFIEQYAPDLPAALRAAGFVEESRTHLMLATPESYRPAPPLEGLEVRVLGPDAPLDDIRAAMTVARRGFEGEQMAPTAVQEAERLRGRLDAGMRYILALLKGEPAGTGVYSAPMDSLTEVAGIATREPFRRRGIAAAVTAAALEDAFRNGVTLAMLSAADERAGRVYERVGFKPFATTLAYRTETE